MVEKARHGRLDLRRGQQGFTVLEVTLAATVGAGVLFGTAALLHSGIDQHSTVVELQQQHHQLERFWETTRIELNGSSLTQIRVDDVGETGEQITFRFGIDHEAGGKTEFGADVEPIGVPVPADSVLDLPSTPGAARGKVDKDANKKPGHVAQKAIKKRRDEVSKGKGEKDAKKAKKHFDKALRATKEKDWSVRYVVLEGETGDGPLARNLYRMIMDDKDKIQSLERVVEHVSTMEVATAGVSVVLTVELANGELLELQAVPKN